MKRFPQAFPQLQQAGIYFAIEKKTAMLNDPCIARLTNQENSSIEKTFSRLQIVHLF
jgi:hypothetical protein